LNCVRDDLEQSFFLSELGKLHALRFDVKRRAHRGSWVGLASTKSTRHERPAIMNIHQIALRLREQMQAFLGNLPVCKTARRFCLEALHGITTRQSLRLSEIARSLNESIAMIKTENRLSRQAARPGRAAREGQDAPDRGSFRHLQTLRPKDGALGAGARRQQEATRAGLLAVPDRGGGVRRA